MVETWNIDSNLVDADWIKTLRWDLPVDVEGFLAVVRPDEVDHFLTLPAARAMPDDLRAALVAEGYIDPVKFQPKGVPVSEALLMEHPGHANQKVHGRRGQMSMGLGGTPGGGIRDINEALDEERRTGVLRVGNSDTERTMAYGDIDDVYENGGGVTASFRVRVTDPEGNVITTYAKPQEGLYDDELRDGIPIGEEMEREVAAHALNQIMGDYVPCPPAVLRRGVPRVEGYNEGSGEEFETSDSSRWVLVAPAESPPKWDKMSYDERSERLAVWDSLIANTDRHGGNVAYIKGANVPIDHSLAFPVRDSDYGGADFTYDRLPLSPSSRRALKSVIDSEGTVRNTLRGVGLSDDAIDGVIIRAGHMLRTGETITPDDLGTYQSWPGWAANPGGSGSSGGSNSWDSTWDGSETPRSSW